MSINDPGNNNFNFIRLAASLLVLLTHTFTFYPRAAEPLGLLTNGVLTGSYLGVCTFFFLSGLLVTQSLRQTTSWKNFLYRRFLRIYPAAWLVIFLCAFVLGPLLTTWKLADYFTNPDFYRFLANAFLFRIQYTLPGVWEHSPSGPGLTSSFWSLCLEVKLYLGLLIIGSLKIPGKKTAALALVLSAFLFNLFFVPALVIPSPLIPAPAVYTIFAPLFGMGALCNIYQDRIFVKKYWIGVIAVLSAIFFYYRLPIPATFLLIPAFTLYAATHGVKWLKKITPKADLSYGIYIFGVPVQKVIFLYFHIESPWLNYLVTSLAVAVFAALSWYGLERKMYALKNRFAQPRPAPPK